MDEFSQVEELGSQPLAIQFLCALREVTDGVSFLLFGTEYHFTWKEFSHHLGFSPCCAISLNKAYHSFSRHGFWGKISGQIVHGKFAPRYNEIQNLTLHLMPKWLAITLFPREDVRPVNNDELMILYAMVKKINISPIKAMVQQWLGNFKMMGPIECTSLITRIATRIGALEGITISFIETPRPHISEVYLVYGHTFKKDPDDSLVFFFRGYTNGIPLPNPGLRLYNCQSLTMPLEPQ